MNPENAKHTWGMALVALVLAGLTVRAPLRASETPPVFSSAGATVVAVAAGLEPDPSSPDGERLVVITDRWTDLDQSRGGQAWEPAPAQEIPWDAGGVPGTVTWHALGYENGLSPFRLRTNPPGAAREVRLVNVSGRAGYRPTDGPVITGFVFSEEPMRFLVRAAGPALATFGVSSPMLDPSLTVYDGEQRFVTSVDDWAAGGDPADVEGTAAAVGAFPYEPGSADAAAVVDLQPGAYTVVVGARGGDEGVTLAEAYVVPQGNNTGVLRNLSLRARVEPGERAVIPGFVSEGTSNRRYLIRAVGPGLSSFGVPAPLSDPRLTIFRGTDPVAVSDNWGESLSADVIEQAAESIGAFQLERDGLDSAVVLALPPGLFSVVVEDATASGASGEVLIEVYLIPAD